MPEQGDAAEDRHQRGDRSIAASCIATARSPSANTSASSSPPTASRRAPSRAPKAACTSCRAPSTTMPASSPRMRATASRSWTSGCASSRRCAPTCPRRTCSATRAPRSRSSATAATAGRSPKRRTGSPRRVRRRASCSCARCGRSPSRQVRDFVAGAEHVFVVENNYHGAARAAGPLRRRAAAAHAPRAQVQRPAVPADRDHRAGPGRHAASNGPTSARTTSVAATLVRLVAGRRKWPRDHPQRFRHRDAVVVVRRLRRLRRALRAQAGVADLGLQPKDVAFISGIGCSGKISGYLHSYAFHGVHGRALPAATAVKLANRDLTRHRRRRRRRRLRDRRRPLLARGAPQPEHDLHRHGQSDVRAHQGPVVADQRDSASLSGTSPAGNPDAPLNGLAVALAAGGTFLARGFSSEPKAMVELIKEAVEPSGLRHRRSDVALRDVQQNEHVQVVQRERLPPHRHRRL